MSPKLRYTAVAVFAIGATAFVFQNCGDFRARGGKSAAVDEGFPSPFPTPGPGPGPGPTPTPTPTPNPTPLPTPSPTPIANACTGNPDVDNFCRNGGLPPDESWIMPVMADRMPNQLQACNRHRANGGHDFIRAVITELRVYSHRWGSNWVRGVVGDSNGDVVGYYYGPGSPQENSPYTAIVDVVGGCCPPAGCTGGTRTTTWLTHPLTYAECCTPSGGVRWTLAPLAN